VVNQSLHVLLHGSTRRGHDLVVLDADGTSGHLVQALLDNAERLTELLHTAQVTVVAVTVDTNGNIELDLVVGIIRLRLADIPGNTGATEHDTSEGHVQSISSVNDTNTLGSGLPDTVIRKQLLSLIDTVTELGGPLVDIIQKAERNVLGDTTGANVGSVETGTRNTLVEFLNDDQCVRRLAMTSRGYPSNFPIAYHQLLTLLETPQEGSQGTDVHGVGKDGHEVVQDTGELAKQGSNPLGTLGDLDVEELLNGQGEALLVGHHGDVVQSVEVRQGLHISLVLNQLLRTTVKQTDVGIGANDLLAIELQNQSEHTVSSRMLRTEVDSVVTDLAVNAFGLGLESSSLWVLGRPLVGEVSEGRVGRNEPRSLVASGLGMSARNSSRNGAGSWHRCVDQVGGAETESFGRIAREAGERGGHEEIEGGGSRRGKKDGWSSVQTHSIAGG
jgi:hypothetical protein